MARPHGRLEHKVALITGAGGGIGRATAVRFGEEGAAVVCADLTEDSNTETADLVTAAGGRAVAVPTDVTSSADLQAAVATAEEQFGGLHVLFNNAGIMHNDDTDAIDTEESVMDLTFAVNVKATTFT